ncbi:hypothetical protein COO60DRAFT_1464121 [Scenedesmus sp. NREL 46B-D3]|nr:hypothetical protein COO60DRAFT_1464121 [Scenedesmus sp. NREL 46B-D3]
MVELLHEVAAVSWQLSSTSLTSQRDRFVLGALLAEPQREERFVELLQKQLPTQSCCAPAEKKSHSALACSAAGSLPCPAGSPEAGWQGLRTANPGRMPRGLQFATIPLTARRYYVTIMLFGCYLLAIAPTCVIIGALEDAVAAAQDKDIS